MGETYNISEIFYSLQGEGSKALEPTIFIRFFGCNLDCPFCDEPLHKEVKKVYNKATLLKEIKELSSVCKNITITGGEPSLQNINELIEFLQSKGYYVNVESNGYKIDNIQKADYIIVSPKNNMFIYDDRVDEFKILIGSNENLRFAKYCLMNKEEHQKIFIQPINNKDTICSNNLRLCIDAVKNNPELKLSIQLHKFLGVN